MPNISISHKFTLRQNDYKFLIPVRFRNSHNDVSSQVWECLLDTGAHTSVIPEYISTDTGHSLMDGIGGATLDAAWGDSQQTYHHTFIVEIMDRDFRTVLHTLPAATFDCTVGIDHEPILGADNFLKHFRIEFDYPSETVTLHW